MAQMTARWMSSSSPPTGLIGPAVKMMLQHYGLDPKLMKSTGPKNNLLKGDVLSFISREKLSPKHVDATKPAIKDSKPKISGARDSKSKDNYLDIPLTNMRSTIAKRLTASKGSIPHSYSSTSIPANKILALRKQVATENGIKVSLNDFVVKACALALRIVPQLNSQWKNDSAVIMNSIDISVAVATPNGLITPIVVNADRLGVEEISTTIRELAGKAKLNKLKLNEFMGGTFTISNLGMFGISHFTAIINQPQTAILAVGGLESRLDESMKMENAFTVTLCYDIRAIDELNAQQFLDHLKLMLAEPETMLSGGENLVNLAALL